MSYLGIILTYGFISNFALVLLLGLYPIVVASARVDSAVRLALALTVLSSLSALATWALQHLLLAPLGLEYLQLVVFVLATLGLVRLLDLAVRRFAPRLARTLEPFESLLIPNCVLLGIALLVARSDYNAVESLVAGAAAGGGFLLSLLAIAAIREKLESEWVPKPFRGLPIAFISAGLMAMAFLAFDKAFLQNLVG